MATDQQNQGLQAKLIIDRDTAARLGVTPQMIDDALYNAFGQRQISTMYTQLNQYHVILEVDPDFRELAQRHQQHLPAHRVGRQGAAQRADAACEQSTCR